ncbi:hypothetical protein [Deinococcus aquiradiocola]|uniref:Uncharacterized protein n=1 Tax=Deinococcus aquiradiocola TaxID=393059 RepID=A0A917PMM3_9DEIO|nr:hypothetical protein [Deinococcus aquiradiocola]GGJ84015.1 hypothetical protein GCM10008939_29860 [Deinococcus aquiradiocola]
MSDTERTQQTIPETAEPQRQGQQQDVNVPEETPNLQSAPETAQNRGEDALDVALQGSMITSDPPSSLMPEDGEE